ncbi:MAG: hypothetical protein QGH33_06620, partial [Pirellulaceae bacterium]|nr:hypothetical protein [Pirellulaceae bacterium]
SRSRLMTLAKGFCHGGWPRLFLPGFLRGVGLGIVTIASFQSLEHRVIPRNRPIKVTDLPPYAAGHSHPVPARTNGARRAFCLR